MKSHAARTLSDPKDFFAWSRRTSVVSLSDRAWRGCVDWPNMYRGEKCVRTSAAASHFRAKSPATFGVEWP